MILCSLILQLLLIMFGHVRRRYIGKRSPYLAICVWLAYMLSDWVGAVALITLVRANKLKLEPRKEVVALWTPFLLWHLGGPYNITVYALEDNEQWLRHCFGMVFQVGQAIYIFSIYGNDTDERCLKFIASPMLIAEFFKYGERIWALRCANDKELVKSMYSAPKQSEGDTGAAPQMIRTGMYEDNNKWNESKGPVDLDLKKFIYSHLQAKRKPKCNEKGLEFKTVSDLLKELDGRCDHDDHDWSIDATDFTSRIFIWHIATELVYYNDLNSFRLQSQGSSCKVGKPLSDYMMYLVLVRPLMLPKGFNEIINKLTFTQATGFFPYEMIRSSRDVTEAMKEFTTALLSSTSNECMYSMTGRTIENVLFQGVRFAKQLRYLAREERWDHEEKWGLISEVWMEMMIQAASQCSWKEHAQQLRHGGELLTHVALLMAHFGLSTQIQEEKF